MTPAINLSRVAFDPHCPNASYFLVIDDLVEIPGGKTLTSGNQAHFQELKFSPEIITSWTESITMG
jgi:hypothetical protein